MDFPIYHLVRGFLSALVLPNALPRYLHFLLASFALSGLVAAGWFGRKDFAVDRMLPGFDRPGLRRKFYSIAFGATLLQAVGGALVYFTLPVKGVGLFMTLMILLGITAAAAFMVLLCGSRSSRPTIASAAIICPSSFSPR